MTGVPLEIDQDVDLVRVNAPCGFAVRQGADVGKAIEPAHQPHAHRAVVIGTVGIGEDLEAAAIMALEQLGHQLSGGVLMKVPREIAEPKAVAPG